MRAVWTQIKLTGPKTTNRCPVYSCATLHVRLESTLAKLHCHGLPHAETVQVRVAIANYNPESGCSTVHDLGEIIGRENLWSNESLSHISSKLLTFSETVDLQS